MDLNILYQDSSLVLCIKPVGVESEGEGMPRLLERQLGGSVFCAHAVGIGHSCTISITASAAAIIRLHLIPIPLLLRSI